MSNKVTKSATAGRRKTPRKVTLAGGKTIEKVPRQFKMGGGELCNAKKKSGDICLLAAGWGTPHPGLGRCKFHGGMSPNHLKAAARQEMKHLLGFEMEMAPIDALMWCIRITAGEVHWLSVKLTQTPQSEWLESTIMGKQLNLWARQRHLAIDRLAKYSKWAIDAGIAERQVRIAEMYGETLARLIQGILEELRLTVDQREQAPEIVRRQLALVDQRNLNESKDLLVGGMNPADLPPEDTNEVLIGEVVLPDDKVARHA